MIRLIHKPRWGVLYNGHALWVGVHHSPYNKRFCINLIPMVTFWYIDKGGVQP